MENFTLTTASKLTERTQREGVDAANDFGNRLNRDITILSVSVL